ncbi:uncharacterized protein MELLADRAFT_90988 [Melampsora larici-populina 98AG31]|uniref:GCM domain-containing protein n=1 Tax=Melampsora larici-populina (strain 98AG31 / pathotype 3-4-7) TaxID=747676 RepID=F4R8A1_MELLP|nr:uncharacterized protein MELLADRAFT_90988 [Melampsora larici-populina 98AG31]EGG11649.1 hypothetical protein MELLADRAFT_90988 [Melampsora larici-populina 98AG31]
MSESGEDWTDDELFHSDDESDSDTSQIMYQQDIGLHLLEAETSPPQKAEILTAQTNKSRSKSRTEKVGKKGKKTFGLPLDRPSFQTFIDHGTTLDRQGYPLFPNGSTVFVKQPKQECANWLTVGFVSTTSGGGTSKRPDWRTVRFTCLGVVVCNNPDCDNLGAPPTGKGKIDAWLSKPRKCDAALCNDYLRLIKCKDTICRVDEHIPSGWGVLRHSGVHDHPWPRRRKPDKLALEDFAQKVIENPNMGPLQHKVGRAPAGKGEITTARNYHPSLANLHRLGYYRRWILVNNGIIPEKKIPGSGDNFILDMETWADVYTGGLLSDVTYKFFANGYLLSTSMYSDVLQRWIPIQLTWLRGLSQKHYLAHFKTLMKQIKDSDLSVEERDTLVRNVVDFSLAQKNGFISAYMSVFNETDHNVALSKLRGCKEHFRQQITRLKRNNAIIPRGKEGDFEDLAMSLCDRDVPGGKTYDEKVDTLRRDFPQTKRWIDWWQASNIQAMLFKSRRKQIDDDGLDDDMPETTNAQESIHRVYYMISEGNCTVQVGLVQLYALVMSLQKDHVDLCRGVTIAYGSTKNYEKVAQILGWAKKTRKNREPKNDGQPPDTTEALLGVVSKKKKVGRPKGLLNVDRNPVTTFQGFRSSTVTGRRNRCWMNSMSECLYALSTPFWFTGSKGKSLHVYNVLMNLFSTRATWEVHQSGNIRTILKQKANVIADEDEDHKEEQPVKSPSKKDDDEGQLTGKGQEVKPPERRVRAKPYKRKLNDNKDEEPPPTNMQSKKLRVNLHPAANVAETAADTHEVAETKPTSSPSKGQGPKKLKGWKGYALIDVEDDDKEEVKGSSQENGHGNGKLRKSKLPMFAV